MCSCWIKVLISFKKKYKFYWCQIFEQYTNIAQETIINFIYLFMYLLAYLLVLFYFWSSKFTLSVTLVTLSVFSYFCYFLLKNTRISK